MNQEELLANRYGKNVRPAKRERITAITIAAVALVTFLIWAIAVTSGSSSRPTGSLLSYTVDSPSQVTVEVQVDNHHNQTTICQLEALANDYEVVGYKEVTVPSTAKSVKTSLITVRPAVSAVVKDCWFK